MSDSNDMENHGKSHRLWRISVAVLLILSAIALLILDYYIVPASFRMLHDNHGMGSYSAGKFNGLLLGIPILFFISAYKLIKHCPTDEEYRRMNRNILRTIIWLISVSVSLIIFIGLVMLVLNKANIGCIICNNHPIG